MHDDVVLLDRRRPGQGRPDLLLGPGRVGTAGEEVDDRGEEQERRLLEVDLGEREPVVVQEVGIEPVDAADLDITDDEPVEIES